jgi:hypothetical protein
MSFGDDLDLVHSLSCSGFYRPSDFGKCLRSTGECFLADVGVAMAHSRALVAG